MKNFIRLILCLCVLSIICPAAVWGANLTGKKIIFVDSYNMGYPWSDGEIRGVKNALRNTGVGLKIVRMDTKRHRAESYKKEAALRIKNIIDKFKPDLIIAADDNAAKYLIKPYFVGGSIPVIFCGINWDASVYGFPTKNITGVVEVDLMKQMVSLLEKFAKGKKIGTLYLNTLSARKIIANQEKILNFKYHTVSLVDTFAQWKEKYLEMQDSCDILIIGNQQGMKDWNEDEFVDLALKSTKIPTGTTGSWRMPFTLLGYLRIPDEQGELAAKMAIRVLNGERPADIPVERNKEAKVVINQALSDKLGITFPRTLLKIAEIIWP